MPRLSFADHSCTPPRVELPDDYNAAHDLLERNPGAERRDKLAYIDDREACSFLELSRRVNQCANALLELGMAPEQSVLLCLQDTIDFPVAFLGCIKAGIIPVAVNTLLTARDYEFMLRDSRARVAIVSAALVPAFEPLLIRSRCLEHLIVSRPQNAGFTELQRLLEASSHEFEAYPTCPDDAFFWLYSSGSTGSPKGTIHVHGSLIQTAELYGRRVLGIRQSDVVFSAAKLFFAYGLGNALTFPLSIGATTTLMSVRPTPETIFSQLVRHQPTIFCGVPTLYASLLAYPGAPRKEDLRLRSCISAGEALSPDIAQRWAQQFGIEILDGIGSTEMLHIFLSNRRDDIQRGTTGLPVPGYELQLLDDAGQGVAPGEVGDLHVAGPSAAAGYWNNREKTRATFHGRWIRTGDKYFRNPDGHYVHAGRSDDMLKVSGIYVSPLEVEAALATHPAVREAAVVGKQDAGRTGKADRLRGTASGHRATP
jgi:benzoate-CoA ligase